ncbi:MAG: SRPBCC family protein [Bacteroidetes bacterium]|nr:SRPBCC family protein [Bacteroidota bacterium]
MKSPHIFQSEITIDRTIDEVFEFFSNAENLNVLTPSNLHFTFITPTPIDIKRGAIIDYRIKLFGVPVKWRTQITKWEPTACFADNQERGPFKLWYHVHTFKAFGSQTIMTDTVHYLSPGGILEFIPHILFVKRQVHKIFEYREKAIQKYFAKI